MKTLFWYDLTSKKKVFVCFSTNVGRHFILDFQGFCPNFQSFSRIFSKSKLLGVRTPAANTTGRSSKHYFICR